MPTKLLIVEDEPSIAAMYKLKFEQYGYTVQVADNGELGFNKAKSWLPDAILLDVVLPKANGIEVLKLLKATPDTKKIPVFLASNLGREEGAKEWKKLGAVDYLIKANYTPSTIAQKIDSALKMM